MISKYHRRSLVSTVLGIPYFTKKYNVHTVKYFALRNNAANIAVTPNIAVTLRFVQLYLVVGVTAFVVC